MPHNDAVIQGLLLQIRQLEQDLADPSTAPYAARCIGTAAAFVAEMSATRAESAVQEARRLSEELRGERQALGAELRRMRALNAGLVVSMLALLLWSL